MRLEILVEELSAEAALRALLPKIVGAEVGFEIRVFRGKADLLDKLPRRLAGYAGWIHEADTRIVVLLDRDDNDCAVLKQRLEQMASAAGLPTRAMATSPEQVLFLPRIAVEELEAWFLGDVPALRKVFPRVPGSLAQRVPFRDPDAVTNTWEALERLLRRHGYQTTGLRKVETATAIAPHMDVEANRSVSFTVFRNGVRWLAGVSDAAT